LVEGIADIVILGGEINEEMREACSGIGRDTSFSIDDHQAQRNKVDILGIICMGVWLHVAVF
jgi:hypothetical protein